VASVSHRARVHGQLLQACDAGSVDSFASPGLPFASRSPSVAEPPVAQTRGAAVILSPPWGVSHVALRGLQAVRGHVILSGVSDVADARRPALTCDCPPLDAAFGSHFPPRTSRGRHVSHAKTPHDQGFFQTDLR
jgi:hypothetical protein